MEKINGLQMRRYRFREAMETYFAACEELSSSLLSAMAVGLGKNFDHFKKDMRKHTSYLRLNYIIPFVSKKLLLLCMDMKSQRVHGLVLTSIQMQEC